MTLNVFFVVYFVYVAIKIYISFFEVDFVKKAMGKRAVVIPSETYMQAGNYKIESQKMNIVSSLYDLLLFFAWLTFGLKLLDSLLATQETTISATLFVLVFIAINYLLSLPFELYQTFGLDKRYGFSTIDAKTFVFDQLKGAAVFLLLGSAVIGLIVWIIDSFEQWWLYGFGAIFAIVLLINVLYPFYMMLFNKFEPLQDETLRDSIENLLKIAGLKSSGVFTIDASKRDKRLNAFFGGLGKSKRVVLFDTLIQKLDKSELLAVLGHELGHFKHKDIIKNIFSSAAMLFVMFAFFGNLPEDLFLPLGLGNHAHMIVVSFLLFSPVLSFFMMPLMSALSRHNEYRADEYGSECESSAALGSALKKLASENKSFPLSHPLSIFFYHTHPELVQRLERLGVDVSVEH